MNRDADRELSRLYRAGASEEPAQWLDDRILSSAGRGLRDSVWQRLARTLRGWHLGVGALAVVTLSTSLVIMIKQDAPSVLDASPSSEPAPPPLEKQRSAVPDTAVDGSRTGQLASNVQAPRASAAKPETFGALQPRPKAEARADAAQATASHELDRSAGHDSPGQAAGPPAPAAEPARPASSPPSLAAVPAPAAKADTRAEEIRVPEGNGNAARRMVSKEADARGRVADEAAIETDPDAWLRRLSERLRQGREAEVVQELRRFRQRFPDRVLPPELSRLLLEIPGGKAPAPAPVSPGSGASLLPEGAP